MNKNAFSAALSDIHVIINKQAGVKWHQQIKIQGP